MLEVVQYFTLIFSSQSWLSPVVMQVKQEAQQQQQQLQQQEEVICIKEEPEEEQEVTATVLLDCQVQQDRVSESEVRLEMIIKSRNVSS